MTHVRRPLEPWKPLVRASHLFAGIEPFASHLRCIHMPKYALERRLVDSYESIILGFLERETRLELATPAFKSFDPDVRTSVSFSGVHQNTGRNLPPRFVRRETSREVLIQKSAFPGQAALDWCVLASTIWLPIWSIRNFQLFLLSVLVA